MSFHSRCHRAVTGAPRKCARAVLRTGAGVWLRHRRPIFLLGNQKSGTTAIAALLAAYLELPVTLDLQEEIRDPLFPRVRTQGLPFRKFIGRNWRAFTHPIIKEPNLTIFWPELRDMFPRANFVFIVRDPRDNIRSILNRLKLPGHLENLQAADWDQIPPVWRPTLDGAWLGLRAHNYIGMLAARWKLFAETYFELAQDTVLIQYEDFCSDKEQTIVRLAKALGQTGRGDIAGLVDKCYQPRGDRDVSWIEFFGSRNLELINEMCAPLMKQLQYPITSPVADTV